MWKLFPLMLLLAVALVNATPTHAFSFSEVDDAVVGFFKGIINKVKEVFTSVFDSIKNAITGFINSIGNGLKDFASTVFNSITKPFTILADSFKESYEWFRDRLGPAAPIGFTIIVAGAVYLMFRLAKIIAPGPIP